MTETLTEAIAGWEQNADVKCYLNLKEQQMPKATAEPMDAVYAEEIRALLEKLAEVRGIPSVDLARAAIDAGTAIIADSVKDEAL